MFDRIVKIALVSILVSALVAAGSTAFTFATTSHALKARSESGLIVRTAIETRDILVRNGLGCENLSVNSRPRIADSEVLCFDNGSPWVILAFNDAYRMTLALAQGTVASGCRPRATRKFVMGGLVIFRTPSERVAAKLASVSGGPRFVMRCGG